MTGYRPFGSDPGERILAIGPCVYCREPFPFHPELVCSIVADAAGIAGDHPGHDPATAARRPICRACVDLANQAQARAGLPLHVILPGAYR